MAEQAADARRPQADRLGLRKMAFRFLFDDRPGLAADDGQQQFRGALHRQARQRRVHAALETLRGFSLKPPCARASGDGVRAEMGALEKKPARAVADRGIESAHDAGQC